MLRVLIRIASPSTHNIGFYEDLTKIIFELSSNTHLISSFILLFFKNKTVHNHFFIENMLCDDTVINHISCIRLINL